MKIYKCLLLTVFLSFFQVSVSTASQNQLLRKWQPLSNEYFETKDALEGKFNQAFSLHETIDLDKTKVNGISLHRHLKTLHKNFQSRAKSIETSTLQKELDEKKIKELDRQLNRLSALEFHLESIIEKLTPKRSAHPRKQPQSEEINMDRLFAKQPPLPLSEA